MDAVLVLYRSSSSVASRLSLVAGPPVADSRRHSINIVIRAHVVTA